MSASSHPRFQSSLKIQPSQAGRGACCAAIAVLMLLTASSAGAALIETDLLTPGDGLLVLDTDTNFEWLDLTETLGMSYDDILGGAGGFVAMGFRFATTPEVATLWANAGIVNTTGSLVAGNFAGVDLLITLMGCNSFCETGDDVAQGQAEFDPAQTELNGPYIQLDTGSSRARADIDPGFTQARDFSSPTLSSYLVRVAIPEPHAPLLVAFGLLGLTWLGRRQR